MFLKSCLSFCRTVFVHRIIKQVNHNLVRTMTHKTLVQQSSINFDELNKFRKLSNKWWEGTEFLPLRNMNQLRVPFIVDAFQSKFFDNPKPFDTYVPLENLKLLDVGCGGGILSESLARLGANITGIDPVEQNVAAAIGHSRITFGKDANVQIHYQCSTIEDFCAKSENQNSFDGVVISEVLEHVDDISGFLQSSISCIKPGGFLFITTINQTLPSLILGIFIAENILGLVPKGTHQYNKFIPPAALDLILKDYGCNVLKVHGMGFNPLTFQWSWIQDQSINYAMMAVKQQ